MTPSQVYNELEILLTAGLAPFIHGPTGIGKSTVVGDFARDHNLEIRDVRASQLDPVDARGVPVPVPSTRTTSWYPPDFLPVTGKGILFLDELNRANQDTQSALYQLILERRIGDYRLPDHWSIVSAGNREIDGCMVQPMSRALKNRFVHLEMESSYEDWHKWAHRNKLHEKIIAYMKQFPSHLNEAEAATRDDKGKRQNVLANVNAFATPRSWAFASRYLEHATAEIKGCFHGLSGIIGAPMAGQFISYCDIYMELPDLDEIIAHPAKFKAMKDPNKLYAICTGLAARVSQKTFAAICKILEKVPPEYALWTVDDCLERDKSIAEHPSYIEFVFKNIEYAS